MNIPPSLFRFGHVRRTTLIEPLEARIAPATATYIGPDGGSWETPGNWDIGRVPGSLPTDATDLDVVINPAGGEFTVNFTGARSVLSLTMAGDDHLTLGVFSALTLNAASSIANGFTINSGTLNAGPDFQVDGTTSFTGGSLGGTVTNHGAWNWSGGVISATFNNASDGTLDLIGTANKRLSGGTVNNAGTMTVSGSNTDVHGNGVYNNLVSGVVNLTTDSSVFGTDGSGNFNNAGTVQKTAGAGETYFGNTRFNNAATGIVSVESGSLLIAAGGTSTGGDFSAAMGSSLILQGSQNWSGTFTGSGAGVVQINNSHIVPGVGGMTLDFDGSGIEFGGASFIDGGTTTNTGLIKAVSNFQSFRLHGATVINLGTIVVVPGAGTEMYTNSVITNQAGALYHIQADGSVMSGDGTGTLVNFGTIQRSVGTGAANFGAKLNNQPSGIIDVDTGELRFVNGGVSTGATFDIASGAQVTFSGTGQTWGGTMGGTGAGTVLLSGIFITPAVGGLTLNFTGEPLHFGDISYLLGGTVMNTGGVKVVEDNSSLRLAGGTFINAGTVQVANVGMSMFDNAIFENQAGRLFDIQTDGAVISGDGTGSFNNFGTIQRSSGAGAASFGAKLNNQPNGIIDVDTGELRFINGGVSTGATFDIASGAQVTISGTAPTWSGTFTGSGAGSLVWAGPVNPGAASLTLNFPAGFFKWGGNGAGGAITLGAGTVTNLGFITLTGANGAAQMSGTTFLNAGTITESDANVNFNISGGSFTNLPTGVFDIQRDGVAIGGNAVGHFINVGEVRKSAGAGEARIQVPFDNGTDGVVNVTSGSLAMVSGGTSTGGHFNAGAGASIVFRNTPQTWSGTFTGSGPGTVQFHAGRVNVGSPGLTLDFPADVFLLGGNGAGGPNVIAGGTVNNTGFITLAGPGGAAFFENATLNNSGTITANDDDVLLNLTSSTFNNLATGVFDIQRDGVMISGNGAGLINNAGVFKKTASFEVTFHSSNIQEAFNNTGTVEVRAGTLNFTNVTNLSGGTLTGGTWRVVDDDPALPNTTLSLPQNITTNAATVVLDGTTAQMPQFNAANFATNNGTLSLLGGRDFTRTGNLTNNGTLSLGPASNFNVTGALTLGADSRVEFLLGGNPPSGDFGTLTVGGAAALAGTAAFTLADGFGPATGQMFTLATFGSRTGEFSAFAGTTLQRTEIFEPVLGATTLVLNAVGDVGDLDVTSVLAPPTGVSGSDVTINWTVVNNGPLATFTDTWTDSVYLSRDDVFDAADKLIGRVTHTGVLGVGGSYNGTLTAPLPGAIPAGYKIIVVTDSSGREADRDRSNNTGASGVITTDVTALSPGVAFMGTIENGEDVWFRVDLPAGQAPHFAANYGVAGAAEFYLRQYDTPDRATFDRFEFSPGVASVDFTQFNGTSGTYYVLLHGREAVDAGVSFTITAEGLPFGISTLDVTQGANLGKVTTVIHGSLFTPQTIFTLVPATGPGIPATQLTYVNSSEVWATFNLSGASLGAYDVVASSPGGSDTLDDGFDVITGVPGRFSYSVSAPQYIRDPFRGAVVTLTYENVGDTDITSPLLLLSSNNAVFFPPTFTGGKANFFELLAVNSAGPAGVLSPGSKNSIQIPFVPQVQTAHSLTPVTASVMDAAGITIDWDLLKDDLQPLGVPDDAYELIFTNFKTQVGGNYATYSAALAADATRLSLLGTRTFDPGVFVAFEMQEAGNFGQITDRYAFGLFGRGAVSAFEIEAITDADGNVSIVLGGDVRNFAMLANGSFASMPGDRAVLTRDGLGQLHLVEGTGFETVFRTDGRFLSNTGLDGRTNTAAYNGIGQIVSITVSDNNAATADDVTTYSLDANGKIATKTDPMGRVTTYTYDASGQHLLSAANAAGTTQYTYATTPGATHAIASITHPDGTHTFNQYDTRGRLIEQTSDGGAEKLTYAYDDAGGVTITDALGNATRLFHDATGHVARIIDPLGGVKTSTFDLAGNLTGASDRAGASVTIGVENNLPTSFLGPVAGATASFNFDGAFDGLQSFTNGNGGTVSYSYDASGNVMTVTRPDGSTFGFRYDASGNLTQVINAATEVTVMSYNSNGLLTGKVFPDGSTIAYTYDTHRNLLTATDASGTVTYTYDAADRVTSVAYPGGKSLTFTYDAGGRRTSIIDQDGFGTKYSYDAVGRLSAVTTQLDAPVASYSYDAAGRLAVETHANGTSTEYSRDALGRVIGIAEKVSTVVQSSIAYTYDGAGRIATSTEGVNVTSYSYDVTGQLVQVDLPGGRTITYAYDAQGNRTSVTDTASGTTGYASNEVDEYTSAGTTTYTYDANSRLSTKTESGVTTIFQYDARGRLVRQFSPTEHIEYEYDALGNLHATTNAAGERTTFLIDPLGVGNVVAEYDTSDALIAHYRHGAGLESRVDAGGAQAFYQFDAIGNTRQITGAAGAVLNSYSYLPFGEKLSASETIENPFTFNGRDGVQDLDDGFYFMRARSYDPALGRFIEIDPLGIGGADTNFFRFANNDPVNLNDPTGLVVPVLGGIASAISTFAGPLAGGLPLTFGGAALGAAGTTGLALGGFQTGLTVAAGQGLVATTTAVEWLGAEILIAEGALTVEGAGWLGLTLSGAGETAAGVATAATVGNPVGLIVVGAVLTAGALISQEAFSNAVENYYSNVDDPFSADAGYGNPNFRPRDIMDSPKVRDVIEKNGLDPKNPDHVKTAIEVTNALTREQQYERDWNDWLFNGMNGPEPQPPPLPRVISEVLASGDPNNIYGPSGFGAEAIADDPNVQPVRFEGFVKPTGDFAYQIVFENMPTASAPAQFVEVTQTLDSDLDPTTLHFTSFGWGDVRVEVPADHPLGAGFTTRVDVRDIYGIFVDLAATIDTTTGALRVTFTAVDPTTGDLPLDALAGFLPPNVTPPEGDGFINYLVQPDAGLADGTEIKAQARIVFDTNPFIDTPEITNKTDNIAPTSVITAFPGPTTYRPTFKIQWSGDDAVGGSGLAYFDVFYTDDGGPQQLLFGRTTDTAGRFTGEGGHTYEFYVTATDNVGNISITSAPQTIEVVTPVNSATVDRRTPFKFTDANGDLVTVRLTGPGEAQVTLVGDVTNNADIDFIVTDDTTTRSNLTVAVVKPRSAGDAASPIGDVTVNGSLGKFTAAKSDLTINGFAATGTVKSLSIRDLLQPDPVLADPAITIGGTNVDRTSVTARTIVDGFTLTTPGILSSVRAAEIGDGTITAAALSRLTTTVGAMDADLMIAGAVGPVTVKTGVDAGNWSGARFGAILTKAGSFDADIDSVGAIAKVTTKGGGVSGQIFARNIGPVSIAGGDFGGLLASFATDLGRTAALKSLTISGGDLTGDVRVFGNLGNVMVKADRAGNGGDVMSAQITAAKIGNVTVAKNVTDSVLLAGADLGDDFVLGGMNDTFGPGTIGRVKIGGAVNDSVLAAGLDPVNGVFDDGDDLILGAAASFFAGLTITLDADADSYFAAGLFKGVVRINGIVVTPATDPRFKLG